MLKATRSSIRCMQVAFVCWVHPSVQVRKSKGVKELLIDLREVGVDWVGGAGGFRWWGSGERLEGPEIAAIGDERRERVAGGGEERGGGEGSEQRDEDRGVHGWGKGRGGWSVSYSRA